MQGVVSGDPGGVRTRESQAGQLPGWSGNRDGFDGSNCGLWTAAASSVGHQAKSGSLGGHLPLAQSRSN